jgi:uncharacterized protein (TIGR02172 family)
MQIVEQKTGTALVLALAGKLDISTAPELEKALVLEGITELTIDLDGCAYVSSAGLREILRARKQMAAQNGSMVLINVHRDVLGVLELTGLTKLITIRPKAREISIDGLEFISAGVCGECFRLDRETIVKLYNEGIEPDIAEKEKTYAKAAFVMGIPTAISYDVVRCGTRTGVVYEMLDAQLFSTVIRHDLANIKQHARTLADIAATVHATEADPTIFPDIKDNFRQYIRQMDFFLSPQEIAFLLDKLESIPDATNCVHFDLHTSNIMIKNGEPIIIDMGDLSRGSYLFDIGVLCTIYGYPELAISEMATRIPSDQGFVLWESFLEAYFANKSQQDFDFFLCSKAFFASLRLIYTITFLPALRDQLASRSKIFCCQKCMPDFSPITFKGTQ